MLKAFGAFAVASAIMVSPGLAKPFEPSPDAIRSHMQFLASDLLEGREAGTRGYDIAASYVASRLLDLGLAPAGDGGTYLQRVPMLAHRAASKGKVVLRGPGGAALRFGDEYLPGTDPFKAKTDIIAPMVFVGFGVVEPRRGRDDYAGLDVRGKIAVILSGAPKDWQGEERAHLGNARNKRVWAAERGAAGIVFVETPTTEKVTSFARRLDTWDSWRMGWRRADGAIHQTGGAMPVLASVSVAAGPKLFAGAPMTFAAIVAEAEGAGNVKGFALPLRADIELATETRRAESSNVAGLVRGRDPRLRDEVVVLSGHLDHVGIGKPKSGDAIYNGAMDNAAGIATLIEVARGLAAKPPRRSVMILAVTAEEKGLVGSDYFARHPTVARGNIVANVNLDMPVINYDFRDIIAFGADRSTIGAAVVRAAKSARLTVTPDPTPDQGTFTRSDHYRFVEQGIPSIFLKTGVLNGGAAALEAFRRDRYHQANDDLAQPTDYAAGARFATINHQIARELADAPVRPAWKKGDFFGTLFGGSQP